MTLTKNQNDIRVTILSLCKGEGKPFCTMKDIAENLEISKKSVQNNIEAAVEYSDRIESVQVDRANVYYIGEPEIGIDLRDGQEAVKTKEYDGDSAWAICTLDSPNNSILVYWYDHKEELMESYSPTIEEIGAVANEYEGKELAIEY